MEYVEEDRKQPEEDVREVGFWTTRNKIIIGVGLGVFVLFGAVYFIGSAMTSNVGVDNGSSDDGNNNNQPQDVWPADAPAWAKDAVFSPDEFEHCFVDDISDEVPGVVLCWKVSSAARSRETRKRESIEDITVGVVAPALGGDNTWVGFGLSANGGMYGADIVTFSPNLGMQDRFSEDWVKPQLDGDNIENVYFQEGAIQGQAISFVFNRAVKVCEEGQEKDFDVVEGLNNVIWAVGSAGSSDITYHLSRGSILLDLLSGNNPPAHEIHTGYVNDDEQTTFGEQTESFDILMGDANGDPINLADHTSGTDTYLCKMFKGPEVLKKQHILEVDAIVEHSQYVHHILLYHCTDVDEENSHWFEPGECRMGCTSVAAAWAVGGYSRFHYPENVGFPFGETVGKQDYFRLEIHYNTVTPPGPEVMDQSGFRIRYADPREYDAGSFFFGWSLADQFTMEPGLREGVPETTWDSYVTSECLTPVVPEEGIHVFSAMFHMHTYGRSALLQRYRDGKEIEPFGQMDYYDFNYQRLVPTSKKIYPTDTLKLTCRYDTTKATETVEAGEGSGDEMCLFFLSYYPRQKQLDHGVATISDQRDGTTQNVWCGGNVQEVDKRVYDQMPKYEKPKRNSCE